jgi:molybdopterin adenylyltransferase
VLHVATGDEVVSPDLTPARGQIRDSNSTLVRAFLGQWGITPEQLRVGEDRAAIEAAISTPRSPLAATDVLLISGGASVGEHDFTRGLLEQFGFTVHVNKAATRPGKPLIVAQRGRTLAFGLPGNPLAHFVCLNLFVRAAVEKLLGLPERDAFSTAVLAANLDGDGNARETLWPAQVRGESGRMLATPLRWSSSGDLTCLAMANALLRVAPGTGLLLAGAEVPVCHGSGVLHEQSRHRAFSHLNAQGTARMVGAGHKPQQLRRAVAAGSLVCRRSTIAALKAKALPKGDVLTVAQIACIQAVKRCAELIPRSVIRCRWTASRWSFLLRARPRRDHQRDGADGRGDGGVDRRERSGSDALRHVQGGGQDHAHRRRARGGEIKAVKIRRLTISDRASADVYADRSGPAIEAALRELFPAAQFVAALVPDEVELIAAALRRFADEAKLDLVITTGGTGITPRDVTPEATRLVLEKELPGFGEAMRMTAFQTIKTSILSRATAGTRGRCLIVNLPGKPSAVRECLAVLGPALREATAHLRGEDPHAAGGVR